MSVGVSTTACKHTPVGITTHIIILPAWLVGVVESHRDILVTGFCIQHRLDGVVLPGGVYIHPVVFLRIVRNRIVDITHTLSITTMSALEGVEIHPWGFAPPFGRGVTSTRMIGHDMILVNRLDSGSQCFPNFGLDVALNIATHKPDDVGLVLITVGQERSVFLGVLHTQQTSFYQSTPDAHHTDVDAMLLCHIDDIVHVVPITINTLLIDVLEVPSVYVRQLSIDVMGRNTINCLHLNHVIACLCTTLQIPFSLCSVQTLRQ